MKTLMMTVCSIALGFAAFAGTTAGVVDTYQFKATAKHAYLGLKKVSISALGVKNEQLYTKKIKTSSLTGYLVQDNSGDLSFKNGVRREYLPYITAKDIQPGTRCFLVVLNKSAEKQFKHVRILPGKLEAKWFDGNMAMSKSIKSMGYLYLGGETVFCTEDGSGFNGTAFNDALTGGTPADYDDIGSYEVRKFTDWQRNEPEGFVSAKSGIDDYWFTSCYLFGQYNQPNWLTSNKCYMREFADTWMNGAGFGKATYTPGKVEGCCGMTKVVAAEGYALDALSGYMKGGLYLCSTVGENAKHETKLARSGLFEDQFWAPIDGTNTYSRGEGVAEMVKMDVWGDNDQDLRTTDTLYGTWSIKRTSVLDNSNESLSVEELEQIKAWGFTGPASAELLRKIKIAAKKLDKNVTLFGNPVDGALINYSFFKNYLADGVIAE